MLQVKKLTGYIGAEISGVDLSQPLSADTVAEIRRVWLENGVVFFHNQKVLPDEDHIRLGQYFGTLDTTELPEGTGERKHPEILMIDLVGNGKSGGADIFHRDRPYLDAPPMGSILQQVIAPEYGGDTVWMSTYAAYDALSEPMQALVDQLHARNAIKPRRHTPEVAKALGDKIYTWPSAIHPLVEVHPETGRKALNVNAAWTDRILELSLGESEMLLGYLFNHVTDPRFQVRFRWNVGDVAFWDNRCCLHYAVPDYTGRRVMKRVAFQGTKPVGPSDVVAKKAA